MLDGTERAARARPRADRARRGATAATASAARRATCSRDGVELAHCARACSALVERGNEELAATGARPRKTVVSGLDALTPSERRVAELAAEELTNKEIAQALFVTVKTVEVHLSSVYRKLQITSRRSSRPRSPTATRPRLRTPQPRGRPVTVL